MRASRRASGLSRQYAFLSAASSGTLPFFLFMSDASAPSKPSCQRKAAVMTEMMCCVLCSAESWTLAGKLLVPEARPATSIRSMKLATVKVDLSSNFVAAEGDADFLALGEGDFFAGALPRTRSICFRSPGERSSDAEAGARMPAFCARTVYAPGRTAKKAKVPSAFVFVSTEAAVAFSSKKTEASATGLPAELRTVPDRVIAGRGSGAGVCAKVAADAHSNNAATAQDRSVLPTLHRQWLMAGILLMRGRLARIGLGDELRVHPRGDGRYAQANEGTWDRGATWRMRGRVAPRRSGETSGEKNRRKLVPPSP